MNLSHLTPKAVNLWSLRILYIYLFIYFCKIICGEFGNSVHCMNLDSANSLLLPHGTQICVCVCVCVEVASNSPPYGKAVYMKSAWSFNSWRCVSHKTR